MSTPRFFVAALCISAFTAATTLRAQFPSASFDGLRNSLVGGCDGVGDVDADGYGDVVLLAGPAGSYGAEVRSGRTGGVLHSIPQLPRANSPLAVSGAGDVDGDGVGDFAVAGPIGSPNFMFDAVRVFSGRTGGILRTFFPNAQHENFGISVDAAGDVNRDGFADVIVGASENVSGPGRGYARVYSGRDASILHTFTGVGPTDAFGTAVSGAGDLDGDGYADVMVAAPGSDPLTTVGYVTIYSGYDGAVLRTIPGNGNAFGVAIDRAGDVDADGTEDVLVGVPGSANSTGHLSIFSGADGSLIRSISGATNIAPPIMPERLGTTVAGLGDVNQDGYDDIAAGGDAQARGLIRVYSGRDGSVLQKFDGTPLSTVSPAGDVDCDGHPDLVYSVAGSVTVVTFEYSYLVTRVRGAGARFGSFVRVAGDVDNDGFGDVVSGGTGVPSTNMRGNVTVLSGRDGSALRSISGVDFDMGFGRNASGAGDVDNDGFADIIASGDCSSSPCGSGGSFARVYSGRTGGALWTFINFTGGVSGVGDVNGDGHDDVIVGSPVATVFSGRDGSTLYTFAGFAGAVSDAGDVDRDGVPDILVASPVVTVFSGRSGSVLHSFPGFGGTVRPAGDLDGDGFDDVLVSEPIPTVFSGRTGATLRTFTGHSGAASGVSDANGDGVPDYLIGNHLVSGSDGSEILQMAGDFLNYHTSDFGAAVDGADLNGDGRADLFLAAPLDGSGFSDQFGTAYLFLSDRNGAFKPYGIGCVQSNTKRPVHSGSGTPVRTGRIEYRVRGALPNAAAVLFVGFSRDLWQGVPLPLPLTLFGGDPSCSIQAEPIFVLPLNADGAGDIVKSLRLNSPLGAKIYTQFLLGDVGSTWPYPIVTSNGLETTIGW